MPVPDEMDRRHQDHDPSDRVQRERASEKLPLGLVAPTHRVTLFVRYLVQVFHT